MPCNLTHILVSRGHIYKDKFIIVSHIVIVVRILVRNQAESSVVIPSAFQKFRMLIFLFLIETYTFSEKFA